MAPKILACLKLNTARQRNLDRLAETLKVMLTLEIQRAIAK